MKKTTLIASLLAFSSITAFAADYYVVVPSLGKTSVPTEPAAPPAPTITLTLNGYPLPAALVGRAYAGFDFNTVLQVSGDVGFDGQAVSWTLVGGALPEGLALGADGVLAGTPTAAGNASFLVKASYKTADGTQAFELLTGEVSVALASAALPAAVQGAAYFHDFKPQLSVSGDPAFNVSQVLWTLEGALPQGLVLNADGTITGVPTAEGSYPLIVRAQYLNQQGTQAYQVLVGEIVVSLAAVTAPAGVIGQAYAGLELAPLVSVTGDAAYAGEGLSWRMAAGALPAGLTLTDGAISGTPSAKAAGPATVEVSYKGKTAQQPVTIAVADSVKQYSGYRAWSDGAFARSCNEYRNPLSAANVYVGAVGDGTYRIDPDGAGAVAPFDVHCDMTTAGGGWTRVGYASNLAYAVHFPDAGNFWRWLPADFSLSLTTAQINALRAVSSTAKQKYVGLCNGVVHYSFPTEPATPYHYAVGFRFHTGVVTNRGAATYTPATITVTQDNCQNNGGEGGTVENATIFEITNINLPVVNIQTLDNGAAAEAYGSPLTQNPAWFK